MRRRSRGGARRCAAVRGAAAGGARRRGSERTGRRARGGGEGGEVGREALLADGVAAEPHGAEREPEDGGGDDEDRQENLHQFQVESARRFLWDEDDDEEHGDFGGVDEIGFDEIETEDVETTNSDYIVDKRV